MADIITTAELLLLIQNRDNSDPGVRERYNRLRLIAERMVRSWIKWDPCPDVATVTRYRNGNGANLLLLPDPFVSTVTLCQVDMTGAYGQGPNAFTSGTLTLGQDYALVRDHDDYGKSGMLQALASQASWWFPSSSWWYGGSRRTGLSFVGPPVWPAGAGNIKVTYVFGFTSQTVPEDLKGAVVETVQIISNATRYGGMLSNEHLGDYNYSLVFRDAIFAGPREALAPYRWLQVGGVFGN